MPIGQSTPVSEFKADHPVIALFQKVPEVLTASEGYNEIWGITIVAPKNPAPASAASEPEAKPAEASPEDNKDEVTPEKDEAAKEPAVPVEQPDFYTALILQKFLRANKNNITEAFNQLKETMVWRKSYFGPGGESEKGWSDSNFAGLGYTTKIKDKSDPEHETVVSWNIYGAAKNTKATFGDIDEFIRWRVALMESSLKMMELEKATTPIPDYNEGTDPYLTIQVHDYQNVSFFRIPSEVKAASRKTIQMFGRYYPETLSQKFFVNVPLIMGWVYTLMKKIVAMETMEKLEMIGSGSALTKSLGDEIPEVYGGKGAALESLGQGVTSPRDVDGEKAADDAAEADAKKAAEETKEAEDKKDSEPAKEEGSAVKEPEATPVSEDAKPAAIEPLPLTDEPTVEKTADPVSTTSELPKVEETATATEDVKKETTMLPVVPETK